MVSKPFLNDSLTLVLDAYNVIHAVPRLEKLLTGKLENARAALIQACVEYRKVQRNIQQVLIVFDGRKDRGPWDSEVSSDFPGIKVLFSDPGQTADDKIIELLEDFKSTQKCVVVSNDNYVANNARAFGVRVVSVQTFDAAVREKQSRGTVSQAGIADASARKITEEYRKLLGL